MKCEHGYTFCQFFNSELVDYYVLYHKWPALKKCMFLIEYRMNIALAHLKYKDNISRILRGGRPLCIPLSNDKIFLRKQFKVANPFKKEHDFIMHIFAKIHD